MIYLLDANVLIDANRDYYPIGRVDEFWEWLVYHGEQGSIKIPVEIYEELKAGKRTEKDELVKWVKDNQTEAALKLDEEVDVELVRKVTEEGYANDLTDIEIETLGRDPFFIAYALVNPAERSIVTTENSKPSKQRQNKKIPDVCDYFEIKSFNTYQLTRALDFKTNWRADHS